MAGANPNLSNKDGWHPLHLASFKGATETLNYLVSCNNNLHHSSSTSAIGSSGSSIAMPSNRSASMGGMKHTGRNVIPSTTTTTTTSVPPSSSSATAAATAASSSTASSSGVASTVARG